MALNDSRFGMALFMGLQGKVFTMEAFRVLTLFVFTVCEYFIFLGFCCIHYKITLRKKTNISPILSITKHLLVDIVSPLTRILRQSTSVPGRHGQNATGRETAFFGYT